CRGLIRRNVTRERHDIESGATDAGIQEQVAHAESSFRCALRQHRIFQDREHEARIAARLEPHALEDVGDRRAPGEGGCRAEWNAGEQLDRPPDARLLARRGGYATGKNGGPAGTLAAAANRKLPIPPAVWRAIATIASPAAVTPAGDALRSGEATCTEKLTFFVVLTSSAAHAPNSGSPPSGESTGPMLRSTPSATTARSSACRDRKSVG